jgi:hypothetical protein
VAFILSILSVIIMFNVRDEVIDEAFRRHPFLAGTELGEKAKEELYNLFTVMQAAMGFIGICLLFVGYLAGKVRNRNNSIRSLRELMKNALRSTEEQLARAKQVQSGFRQT